MDALTKKKKKIEIRLSIMKHYRVFKKIEITLLIMKYNWVFDCVFLIIFLGKFQIKIKTGCGCERQWTRLDRKNLRT